MRLGPGSAAGWPDAADHQPGLVVLADLTWIRWGPLSSEDDVDQPAARHRRFVTGLLGDGDATLGVRDGPGVVWAGQQAPAGPMLDAIVDGLDRACTAHERRTADHRHVVDELNRNAHRVHLAGAALGLLTHPAERDAPGTPGPAAGDRATVDIGFRHHLGNYWMYATLTLWTSRPHSAAFAPPSPGPAVADVPVDTRAVLTRFDALAAAFRLHVQTEFVSVESMVLDESADGSMHRYRPPRFWVVDCCHDGPDEPCPAVSVVGRQVLGVPGPQAGGVSHDTLVRRGPGQQAAVPVTAWRAPALSRDGTWPVYVLAPDATGSRADREEAVAALVGRLARVEGAIAALQLDVTTDLDIDQTFSDLYAALAHKGSLLWDELALNLPLLRGGRLDRLHQLIEMVHLTLLQGLADLQHLRASAGGTVDALTTAPNGPVDRLEQEFVRAVDPVPGRALTDALRSGGYVGPTRRWADAVAAGTAAVADQVTSLLDAISHAFDERRVRDTDKIGRAGLFLALALATVGFVTETYGHLIDGLAPWEHAVVLAALLLVFGAGGALAWRGWVRRHGDLGATAHFREMYPAVQAFVAELRVERLENARSLAWAVTVAAAPPSGLRAAHREYHERWEAIDAFLAQRFAKLVDDLQRGPAATSRAPLDVLRARIEQWGLLALIVGERPRSFYAYPLPRLTLLYRFFPVLGGRVDLYGPDGTRPALVSDADLLLTLRVQCSATLADVPAVRAWGESLTRETERTDGSAADMLDRIVAAGFRAGMNRHDWARTFAAITGADGATVREPDRVRT